MSRHILSFLGLVFSLQCFAQDKAYHLVSKYVQRDGLSSYNIRSIVQDPMGFVWIATQEGLNSFDGRIFNKYTYNSPKDNKILASDVRCLVIDSPRHVLWVLTNIGGINAIDYFTGKVVKSIPAAHVSNDDWSISMVLSRGKLWIGCMTSVKVYDIEKDRWVTDLEIPFTKNSNGDLFGVKTVFAEGDGSVWAFLNHYGILKIDAASDQIVATFRLPFLFGGKPTGDLNFTAVASLGRGQLIVGTSMGIMLVGCKGHEVTARPAAGAMGKLGRIGAVATAGNAVYVADNLQLYRFEKDLKSYAIIAEINTGTGENWFADVQNILIDNAGNGWLGCKQGLAFLSGKKAPFRGVSNTTNPQSGLTHVYSVFPDAAGKFVIGQENGLLTYNSADEKFKSINKAHIFDYIFKDPRNNTIVTGDQGMFILKAGKLIPLTRYYPELKPVAGGWINSHVYIGDSVCVFGSDNNRGIFVWNYKRKTVRIIDNSSQPLKLRSNIVNRVFQDKTGRVWVLSDMGIDIIQDNFSKVINLEVRNPATKDQVKLFFDIAETGKDFWLACYSYGLFKMDRDGKVLKVLTSTDGLSNDGVYKVFNTPGNKKLIITTNNGLSVLDLANNNFTNYYVRDGLHGDAYEEACGTEKDGKIYAGGLNGFTIIDPTLLTTNPVPPKLYLTGVKIDTKNSTLNIKDLRMKSLSIPEDALQTTVSFAGLNFINPGRVKYRYKIEELNSQWVSLGTRNFINIIGISPGEYNLSVEAANEDGIWTRQPSILTLHFLPHWYQTWWFKMLVVLAIGGVFYAIYTYRIRQLKVQEVIRRGIANDLHDDLGSNLNSIKIFTHLALSKKENREYLKEIEQLIAHTTLGLRDMLWVLDDSGDDFNELAERIRKTSEPLAAARNIRLDCRVDPAIMSRKISKTEKRNLFLVAKEAINNSFKYAECQSICLSILPASDKKIILTISDDGCGFDALTGGKGYGLGNIRYRAEQIGYKLQVVSSPGEGTSVIVEKS